MSYLAFLQKLLALGPKLPAIIEKIQHIIGEIQEIIALLSPGPFAAAAEVPFTATAEEVAAEAQVAAVITASDEPGTMRGIGDGSFLRVIWTFVQAHPELLTLLLSIFAKKA